MNVLTIVRCSYNEFLWEIETYGGILRSHQKHSSASKAATLGLMKLISMYPIGEIRFTTNSDYLRIVLQKWLPYWEECGWVDNTGRQIDNIDIWKLIFANYYRLKILY